MSKKLLPSKGVLLSRHDPDIQFAARRFLERTGARIDVITAEDPLHVFFHNVDKEALEALGRHISAYLYHADKKRIILAGGQRPDTLTDAEVHFKLETAVFHLKEHFPYAEVEALFVNQSTGKLEQVASASK